MSTSVDENDAVEECEKNTLEYQLSEQNSILVVSFIGPLTKANIDVLERCKSAIIGSNAISVVLNFQKMELIDMPGIIMLMELQHVARAKSGKLRLCFLQPVFARALADRGGLIRSELHSSLIDAIKSFDYSLTS